MEKLLAVFLHFQIIQLNRNGFEELFLTFDPSQEQMIEVSRFQKLKILKKIGSKEKVIINDTKRPKVIIHPKSIIGFIPLKIKDRKAQIVVNTV